MGSAEGWKLSACRALSCCTERLFQGALWSECDGEDEDRHLQRIGCSTPAFLVVLFSVCSCSETEGSAFPLQQVFHRHNQCKFTLINDADLQEL